MRKLPLIGVILLLVAAGVAWQWQATVQPADRGGESPGAGSEAREIGRRASDSTPRSEGSKTVTAPRIAIAPRATAVAVPRMPQPRDSLEPDRKLAFERLAALQEPASARLAAEVATWCGPYADSTFGKTLARIDAGVHSPQVKESQRETAERERAKCIGFEQRDITRGVALQRFAHENGEARSFAFNMPAKGPIPGLIAAAQDAASLNDSIALREIGSFFTRRTDVPPGYLYDLGDGDGVHRGIIRDAFILAACQYGEDCGPSNGQLAARCVNAGWCDASSLEESLLRYSYSPAGAERLQYARQIVLTGIQTGVWPPGFWSPAPR